ncbi:acireductone synthase [Marinobacterium arenosum]|uniref:acireductone synthase n=1 Tax=Marinobacterium arenosum TaxID=2862496 RepID=UPI001C97D3E9|nr:acireductone synthase [Marinobacterium arenosum]MBY4678938.1 acireductone synthase [Marinobacterium arenosum]
MTIKAILTDIEGTTTDIDFVHKVLFPYARTHLPDYLRNNRDDALVASILEDARAELGQPEADLETLIKAFLQWIKQDKKVTALKSLQGLIWVQGYDQGDFTGHLYEDAHRCLQQWHQQGIGLNIFSSGSVKAQKLLFGYSDFGDLTPLFSGYFDTTTGHKREAASYRSIADAIGVPAEQILFLSDVIEELDAAREAGMQTTLLARDQLPADSDHPVVSSFDQISL